MVLAIYSDGNHIRIPNLDSAFQLPGEYYVFSVAETFNINDKGGVAHYNRNKEIEIFKLNNLELINIEKLNNPYNDFYFSVYDHYSENVKKIEVSGKIFEYALSHVIKQIIASSQYPSWDIYDSVNKIEDYKIQISKLIDENKMLQEKNKELVTLNENLKNLLPNKIF